MGLSVVLPNKAAGAISLNRPPHFRGRRDADSSGPFGGGDYGDAEQRSSPTSARPQDLGEFFALPDSTVSAEPPAVGSPTLLDGIPKETLGPQALPAFGAASLNHQSSPSRSHADEKAVGPSSATIIGLERSLHCFMESLRKVEPAMLSGIERIVKRCGSRAPFPRGRRVMVRASRG